MIAAYLLFFLSQFHSFIHFFIFFLVQNEPTAAVLSPAQGTTTSDASKTRARARRKLPEVPANAEPFSTTTFSGGQASSLTNLLQMAALQRSTSPGTSQQQSRSLSRPLRNYSASSLLVESSLSPIRYPTGALRSGSSSNVTTGTGIRRSSSVGRERDDQSPEDRSRQQFVTSYASMLLEQQMAERRVVGPLSTSIQLQQKPLFINTSSATVTSSSTFSTTQQQSFRSRSLPQSPGW